MNNFINKNRYGYKCQRKKTFISFKKAPVLRIIRNSYSIKIHTEYIKLGPQIASISSSKNTLNIRLNYSKLAFLLRKGTLIKYSLPLEVQNIIYKNNFIKYSKNCK
jgi:hypothetical protein